MSGVYRSFTQRVGDPASTRVSVGSECTASPWQGRMKPRDETGAADLREEGLPEMMQCLHVKVASQLVATPQGPIRLPSA